MEKCTLRHRTKRVIHGLGQEEQTRISWRPV